MVFINRNQEVRWYRMSDILIRLMQENEMEQCIDVIQQGFGTVANEFGLTPANCPTNGAFMGIDRLKNDFNKGNLIYVLCEEDHIIGFMELEQIDENRVELQKLTVLEQYRHYGYGSKLLNFALNKAKDLGAKQITIGIIEENTVLKDWYLKNGFTHNGTRVFDHLPFIVGFMAYEIE
jgi:N-acetylglutamate synthase and related acetyltransferases